MDDREAVHATREDTGALLVSVAARLSRLYGKVLAQLDPPLTFRQQRLLMRVREGHSSLATLAAFGNLTVPTVSESVDVLVRRELMTRTENPESRRSQLLKVTPLGEKALDAANVALREANESVLGDISEKRRLVLHESLVAIFDNATECFRGDGPQAKDNARDRAGSG